MFQMEVQQYYSSRIPVILHDKLKRVSETLQFSYLSHVTATTTSADQYWHHPRRDSRNTMIYAHTTSRTVPTCYISPGSLKLRAPEAGDFVELILL
jgi:hypothetical protein